MKIGMYIMLILIMCSAVTALGVAPAIKEVFYEAGTEISMPINIINNEMTARKIGVVVKGELADYIIADTTINMNEGEYSRQFTYRILLPPNLQPGRKTAEIMLLDMGSDNRNTIMANIGVKHKLHVIVPYPDEYVNGRLYMTESEDEIVFTISLSNVGTSDIEEIKGQILITDPDDDRIKKLETETVSLKQGEKGKIIANWDISDVSPGVYRAQTIVEYMDKRLVIEKLFDIGEPLLEILELRVGSFKLGTIAKFDIIVRNIWNEKINDVYATTEIIDISSETISNYKTSSVDVPPDSKKELNVYWETEGILPDTYDIDIKAHYLDRITEKLFKLDVKEDMIIVNGNSATGAVIYGDISRGVPFIIGALLLTALIIGIVLWKRSDKSGDTKELESYVRDKLKKGYSREAIKEDLKKKGWNLNMIDSVMLKIEYPE